MTVSWGAVSEPSSAVLLPNSVLWWQERILFEKLWWTNMETATHEESINIPDRQIHVHQERLIENYALTKWEESLGLNPLSATFSRGDKNIYLHFMLFFHIGMAQIVEILPQVTQELFYSQYHGCWCPCLHKEPGHQQPWYLLCWTRLIQSRHTKD